MLYGDLGDANGAGFVQPEDPAGTQRELSFWIRDLFAVDLNAALCDQATYVRPRLGYSENLRIHRRHDGKEISGGFARGKFGQIRIREPFLAEALIPICERFLCDFGCVIGRSDFQRKLLLRFQRMESQPATRDQVEAYNSGPSSDRKCSSIFQTSR